MKNLIFTLALLCAVFSAQAQQPAPQKPSKELVQFFSGKWTGEGQFSSGKPIAATLDFSLALDSSWLMHHHTDLAPNTYKATSWWGSDPETGTFVAYIFDNYSGHRKFQSEGFGDGKLVLTTQQPHPKFGIMWQHFIYEKLSADSFKMTYEVSRDGKEWRMVDYLIFKRSVKA
ncbi:DUF1579 domain-containing protein [Pontibacter burrus]|uniref:DUF1579 domain-containing protein n=1 Tax=Pontibacter burrus TaxID=2704466 RepID=A0A6B3LVK4_9BACT|nr:DUF1579 domain-containing protein [Pontibacter burrus]NEM97918.1 DUF1579 domain-containing protein [Pontibacter burrus]